MRRITPLITLLALSACADTTGDWSGQCDIGEVELDVTMSVTEEDGSITGTGTIGYTNEDGSVSEEAEVTGTRDGDIVLLELQPVTIGEMEFDATIDGDALSGSCMWATIEGDALLER